MTVVKVDFTKKKKEEPKQVDVTEEITDFNSTEEVKEDNSFEAMMKKNQANKDKMEQERKDANKSVLRSYRIK